MGMKIFNATLLVLALLVSCGEPKQYTAEEKAKIMMLAEAFSASVVEADPQKIASFYSDSAVLVPPFNDFITSDSAIENYWTRSANSKVTMHKLYPQEVHINGNEATDWGYYAIAGVNNDTVNWGPVYGKYLVVWKKENDEWKMYADAWNRMPQDFKPDFLERN